MGIECIIGICDHIYGCEKGIGEAKAVKVLG